MDKTQPFTEIFPFENRICYFHTPPMRLIGKAMRHTNETDISPIPRFWTEYNTKYHNATEALPQIVRTTVAWIAEYDPSTKQYTYLIGVFCPAGTPVPEGFDYRDLDPALLAHGTLSASPPEAHNIGRFDAAMAQDGFARTDNWSCEFYPVQEKLDCCLLFTVKVAQDTTPST